MKFSEKIIWCRKKSGLSQEMLAEKVGVSRQAVSKWETGESEPEISKLKVLAEIFGVTVDWLLSESEEPYINENNSDIRIGESVPGRDDTYLSAKVSTGFIKRLIRRYGWLAGVYIAVIGVIWAGMGALVKYISGKMLSGFSSDFFNAPTFPESSNFINAPSFPESEMNFFNPVDVFGSVFMAVGIIVACIGIILAVYLKKKGAKGQK